MVSYVETTGRTAFVKVVLILIVVDDGLVLKKDMIMSEINVSLNPYCSGRWSRTEHPSFQGYPCPHVLILVVVEDGLVRSSNGR